MNADLNALETRIDDLEARIAHQDQANVDLSDEVYRQQRQIGSLELQLRHLSDRLVALESPQRATDAAHEVPPHY